MDEGQVWIRFYEELNDFLPSSKRKVLFPYFFKGTPSVKDVIESLGVPHVEVDLIIVNGTPVRFSYKPKNKDQISVYPVFESIDISAVSRLRPEPLRDPKFILDVHLGKLSKYLRLLGFDTYIEDYMNDNEIIELSLKEKRIILTRDKNLLKHKQITHGYWIRSQNPKIQLKEVIRRLDLPGIVKPFTRCLECNNLVIEVPKNEILYDIKLKTKEFYTEFWKCPGCNRIYWKGSHYEKMKEHIESIITGIN